MLPILLMCFFLNYSPLKSKRPKYVGAKHFMKSSSIPPQLITRTSINLCYTKNLMISLQPQLTILLVQAKKILQPIFLRSSGSLGKLRFGSYGSSLKR